MLREPLPQEVTLTSWSAFTLTTHRVIYSVSRTGSTTSSTMILQSISGTTVRRADSPGLIGAAAILAVVGLVLLGGHGPELGIFCMLSAAVLVWLYFVSRHVALIIFGGDRTLRVSLKAAEVTPARQFADRVERLVSLAHRAPAVAQVSGLSETGAD